MKGRYERALKVFGWRLLITRNRLGDGRPRVWERVPWGWLLTWGPLTVFLVRSMRYESTRLERCIRTVPHLWRRARLWATPWPVYIAHHRYCCDTGPFTAIHRYGTGREAWAATTWEAMSWGDGPESYAVVSRQDYDDDCDRPLSLTWDEQAANRETEEDERHERYIREVTS